MRKTLLEIYALAVCFACALIMLGTATVGTYQVITYLNPEFGISNWKYERLANPVTYQKNTLRRYKKAKKAPSEAKIESMRVKEMQSATKSVRRASTKVLVGSSILMLFSMLLFFVHWTIGKRARQV